MGVTSRSRCELTRELGEGKLYIKISPGPRCKLVVTWRVGVGTSPTNCLEPFKCYCWYMDMVDKVRWLPRNPSVNHAAGEKRKLNDWFEWYVLYCSDVENGEGISRCCSSHKPTSTSGILPTFLRLLWRFTRWCWYYQTDTTRTLMIMTIRRIAKFV